MTNSLIEKYECVKKYIPELKLVLSDRLGIVYNDGAELFRTWGPNAVNNIDTYFDGMLSGFNLGLKYANKHYKP